MADVVFGVMFVVTVAGLLVERHLTVRALLRSLGRPAESPPVLPARPLLSSDRRDDGTQVRLERERRSETTHRGV